MISDLVSTHIPTPLGDMLALTSEKHLYLLAFMDESHLTSKLNRIQQYAKTPPLPGTTSVAQHIHAELQAYFDSNLRAFSTPIAFLGTDFQTSVWQMLCDIPYAQTISYQSQALRLQRATAYRAVANANAANPLSIIVPCHRVVRSNGELGGYAGGLKRKQWLIQHELTNRPLS